MNKIQLQRTNNTPTILVVFGITGDLATRKIIPSLWHLFEQNLLSDHFSILGFSRRNFSDKEFKEFIRSAVVSHGGKDMSENDFSRFFAHFSYQSGVFEDAAAFQTLAQSISDKEASWGVCANKLFYLAAPPATYKLIFENLAYRWRLLKARWNSANNRKIIRRIQVRLSPLYATSLADIIQARTIKNKPMNSEHPAGKIDFNYITDGIYIGTNQCCQTHFDEELKKLGITSDISLEEERVDTPFGVDFYIWIPIKNRTAPTQKQLDFGVSVLEKLVVLKKKIYVHCQNGHGRAPTLVAAYLIKKGKGIDEAIEFIKSKRPTIHLEKVQLESLNKFRKLKNEKFYVKI